VVEALLDEPGPAAVAELVEGAPGDQEQGPAQVFDALGAASLPT